jgi:hypothetical protein
MLKDPVSEHPDQSRIILEHELRAAIRIIGYFVAQAGGEVSIPHRVLGTDYRLKVYSAAASNLIQITSRIGHDDHPQR